MECVTSVPDGGNFSHLPPIRQLCFETTEAVNIGSGGSVEGASPVHQQKGRLSRSWHSYFHSNPVSAGLALSEIATVARSWEETEAEAAAASNAAPAQPVAKLRLRGGNERAGVIYCRAYQNKEYPMRAAFPC